MTRCPCLIQLFVGNAEPEGEPDHVLVAGHIIIRDVLEKFTI
jgi:hypothetical protein